MWPKRKEKEMRSDRKVFQAAPFSDDSVLLCLLNNCLPSYFMQFWLFCQSQCIPGNLVLTSHLSELGIQIPRASVQKVAGTYRDHIIGVWSSLRETHMAAICLRKKTRLKGKWGRLGGNRSLIMSLVFLDWLCMESVPPLGWIKQENFLCLVVVLWIG